MSHVAKIELEIRDLDALASACKSLGLELVKGQQAYKWYGTVVGNYPLPEGFSKKDLGKCEHAVRIPGNSAAYEIGVARRRDGRPGYTLLWDFWRGGFGLQDKVGDGGNKLKQSYAAAVAAKHYHKLGYRVTQTQREDGRVILTAVR
jgi:hypothetical protein